MQRKTFLLSAGLIAVVLAVVLAVILVRPSWTVRTVTVKVLLPEADAKLVINGREIEGKGPERTSEITTREDSIAVAASWEPNPRRTLIRSKRIALDDGSALVADLRKPDPSHPDQTTLPIKVMVPQADATLWIDGVLMSGEGTERACMATTTGGAALVSTLWEPNNYTKITRKKEVVIPPDGEVVADLREPTDIKDDIVVRHVATPEDVVEGMCKMAKVTKDDVVYDLGCGDAIMLLIAVQKFGAKRGVGVELDPKMVKIATGKVKEAGLADKIEIRQGDVLKVEDLSDANVVLLYMGDDINNRLKPILKKTLRPGSRVVSHRFLMGEWIPDRTEPIPDGNGIHLWVIKRSDQKNP